MTTRLSLLAPGHHSRVGRDRLELLTALIEAPSFDPLYRADVIEIPPHHPVFGWMCQVEACGCVMKSRNLCNKHDRQWPAAKQTGISRAEFIKTARPAAVPVRPEPLRCLICPGRPAKGATPPLCNCHKAAWLDYQKANGAAGFDEWLAAQVPQADFGTCQVNGCADLAASLIGLCHVHTRRYRRAGKPGSASCVAGRRACFEDEAEFRRWSAAGAPVSRPGKVNLTVLQPLVRAEIKWGMFTHSQERNPTRWVPASVQYLVGACYAAGVTSLFDLVERRADEPRIPGSKDAHARQIVREIVEGLWRVYYSPADSREAGFIETDHFGRRFRDSGSRIDLTGISQRWLRDLLWDNIAEALQSSRCPRTRGSIDARRRGAIELSAFLEAEAPQGGHVPELLRQEHAQQFVADLRRRARDQLPSRGIYRVDGQPSPVTESTRRFVFNYIRVVLYGALESGAAESIGLDPRFITALPFGGADPRPSRSPFSDAVARALADEDNLRQLAAVYDPNDRGVRDAWEAIVFTGRRCREVLDLRLDCIGRYRGLAMLWHDQTKVGNYNEAIRIPEVLYQRLEARRATTLARFEHLHGRLPTATERATMALFPAAVRNSRADRSISYSWFNQAFKHWVDSLDLGSPVVHQARHTLATNLLRAGASIAHIRRYLGQVSDRMAENYLKVAHSDLEDVLQAVWVTGPGSRDPGRLLSGDATPMSPDTVTALSLDLSRLSTPTEGGFCTSQPVVNGAICPWKLDCEHCDDFVISGADLVYWQRKREQWRSIAERAPDDATADYLHKVFEPTARAIDGLEKALAAMGLLDQALTLDYRRPQDYFQRLWNTGFRPGELATAADSETDSDQAEPAGGPA